MNFVIDRSVNTGTIRSLLISIALYDKMETIMKQTVSVEQSAKSYHENTCHKLGIPISTEDGWVNPLRLAINHEFPRRDPIGKPPLPDYRDRAIDRCISHEASFTSEDNTWFEFAKRFINVVCPKCGKPMESQDGSGTGSHFTMGYSCKCGVKFSISGPTDSFHITFPDKQ